MSDAVRMSALIDRFEKIEQSILSLSERVEQLIQNQQVEKTLASLRKEGFLEIRPVQDLTYSTVYVTSNEFGFQRALHVIREMNICSGVYFGVGGLQNWDFIVQQSPDLALLGDVNPQEVEFNHKMLKILIHSASPQQFIAKAVDQIEEDLEQQPTLYALNRRFGLDRNNLFNKPLIDMIRWELNEMLNRKNGVLSKANFSNFRQMAEQGRIQPLLIDLADSSAIQKLSSCLQEQNLAVSFLYLSNAYDYLMENPLQKARFKKNITMLQEDKTCIVDTTLCCCAWMIKSYVLFGKDPLTGNAYDPDVVRGLGFNLEPLTIDRTNYYLAPAPLSEQDDGRYQTTLEGIQLSKWISLD